MVCKKIENQISSADAQLLPKSSSRALARLLKYLFGERPANWRLIIVASAVGLLMAIPAGYIILRALGADYSVWGKLWVTKIPPLLFSTIGLTAAVTALTVVIAVPAAWLVSMTDIPGRSVWRWLLALPLAVPPYIGAFAYIIVLGPVGVVARFWSKMVGVSVYELNFPSVYGFGGALIFLALFTYPYVFLIVSASLRKQNQSLIDAARGSGLSPAGVFFKVTLPLLRPSITAGALLVALYVLSDFGAISLLRYPTFTSAIYQQLVGRYDRESAAALSIVLMALTLIVIWFETRSRAHARYFQTQGQYRTAETVKLGLLRWPAVILILIVLLFALVLPLAVLTYWSYLGFMAGEIDPDFWGYTYNGVMSSGLAATLAVILALPVVYIAARYKGVASTFILRLSYSGYALPGVLIGLGLVFFFNSQMPWFYGTIGVLIVGYVVRFLPQSLQAEEASLSTISPNIEEAAHSFGYGTVSVLRKITIPLMLPAMAAAWTLVFINSMKELAATLLLRPAGFDTLAVRIWQDASEGYFTTAAPAALLLVLISAGPLIIINMRQQKTEDDSGESGSEA